MKRNKKTILIILSVTSAVLLSVFLLVVLFCPFLHVHVDDGGTDMYCATLYRVVCWNSHSYKATRVYWFPDNFKSYDELMEIEKARDDYWDHVPNKIYQDEYNKMFSGDLYETK